MLDKAGIKPCAVYVESLDRELPDHGSKLPWQAKERMKRLRSRHVGGAGGEDFVTLFSQS